MRGPLRLLDGRTYQALPLGDRLAYERTLDEPDVEARLAFAELPADLAAEVEAAIDAEAPDAPHGA